MTSDNNLVKIRQDLINDLPALISKAQETLKGKLCNVFYAKDKEDALDILGKLLSKQKQVVRSASDTLNELSFDAFMKSNDINVQKTNISEIVLDELQKKPEGHPIISSLDVSEDEIINALKKYLNNTKIEDPKEIRKLLQEKIKEEILKCDFGITGCDAVIAENGTIILAEDEGNVRAVSNLPFKHIAVVGIEKIYSQVEDAITTIQGTAFYGLGKNTPTYFSLISGPSRTADIELKMAYGMHGPNEVDVILLDNGRMKLIEDGHKDLLKCIGCGKCFKQFKKFAQENNLTNCTLTPKNIALGIRNGNIKNLTSFELEEFECPVGLNRDAFVKAIKDL